MTDLEQKPRLRFKGFTEAWEQRKLGDIFEFERPDKYMIKDDHYEETGIPVLTANKAFILGYKNETGAYSKGDCIIFDDFTLDSKYVDFPYKINSSVIKILTLKDNSNLKFDYYLLNQAKILQQGHARHYISVVQPTIVNVPKKCESNKIEKLFTNLDSLITLHQRKYEKLKSMKAALLEKMFPSENETTPKIRFKGFTEAWEQRKLGDIFEFERPDKYMIKDDHYEETGIPVLTANKAFILGYKNETGAYSKGDCIIFDDFTLDSKYVDFPYKINSSVIKILTLKDNSNLKFDYYLLNQAKILQQGHARHYISVVQPTIVNVPKKCESNKIEKLFTNLDSLITLHQRKCEKLKNLKKSLLERMFI